MGFRLGETYCVPQDISGEAAIRYWFAPGHEVFVFDEAGQIAGTYFLRPNQGGGGAHVAIAAI